MKKILLIVSCLLLPLGAFFLWPQPQHLRIFPDLADPDLKTAEIAPELLQADIEALYTGALRRHPQLDNVVNRQRLRPIVNALKAEITQPMTRVAFFRHVGQLNQYFEDGHSFLIWPYQEYADLKRAGQQPFPFSIQVREGQMRMVGDYSFGKQTLKSGTQILAINQVPAQEIIAKLQGYTGGETRHLREQIAAERFAPMLWTVYGFIDRFTMRIEDQAGPQEILVNKDQWPQKSASHSRKDYQYKELIHGVGLIKVSSFDTSPADFADFVDQTFATIRQRKLKALIIDIRGNTGGNTDTVTYLSRYLATKKFRMISHMTERLNENNRGLFRYRGQAGSLIEKEWEEWEMPIEKSKRFKGSVYLLVDAISYSASIVFATTLKDNGFALLIGQKTGGNANQTAQGHLFNLPHSQLRAYIATRLLVRPSGDRTRSGVLPHFEIAHSPEGLRSGSDPELKKALDLISENTPQLR